MDVESSTGTEYARTFDVIGVAAYRQVGERSAI
jgi:hypothetical protein